MIIKTMSRQEITTEVLSDYHTLLDTTIDRLSKKYNKERRKKKIDRRSNYPRVYTIKTKRKNNWMILMNKAPSDLHYKGLKSVRFSMIVTYDSIRGLQAISVPPHLRTLNVYNGHLFKRYAERMKYDTIHPLQKVKRFFIENPCDHLERKRENKTTKIRSKIKCGLLLGSYDTKHQWVEYRTFIDNSLFGKDQTEFCEETLRYIDKKIFDIVNNDSFTDQERSEYKDLADIRKAIE